MSKHTPGPWTADGSWPFDGFDYIKILAPSGREIASVIGPQMEEQRQADAALMAAAPDLLAALHLADDVLRNLEELTDAQFDTLQAVRVAIAKAEGEQ